MARLVWVAGAFLLAVALATVAPGRLRDVRTQRIQIAHDAAVVSSLRDLADDPAARPLRRCHLLLVPDHRARALVANMLDRPPGQVLDAHNRPPVEDAAFVGVTEKAARAHHLTLSPLEAERPPARPPVGYSFGYRNALWAARLGPGCAP